MAAAQNIGLEQWRKCLHNHVQQQLAYRFDFSEAELINALDGFFIQMLDGDFELIEQVEDFQKELRRAEEDLRRADKSTKELFKQRSTHYRVLQRTLKDKARELNRSFQEQIKANGKIREKAVQSAIKAEQKIPSYLPSLIPDYELSSSRAVIKKHFSPFLAQLEQQLEQSDQDFEEAKQSYVQLSNYVQALQMSPLAQYAENYSLRYQGRPVPDNNVRFLTDYQSHFNLCLGARNRILSKLVERIDPVFERVAKLPKLYPEAAQSIGTFVWEKALFDRWDWLVFYEMLSYFSAFRPADFMQIHEVIYYGSPMEIKEDRALYRYERRVLQSALIKQLHHGKFNYQLPHSARQRHSFILGKTGSGKTEFLKLLIHEDITANRGVLLLDPHGDLAQQCSRFRLWENPLYRDRLVYVSADYINQGVMPLLNPFTHDFHEADIHEKRQAISIRVGELMSAFEVIFRGDFTDNMRLLLDKCLRLLLVHPTTGIQDLLDLLYPYPEGRYLEKVHEHYDESVRRYFAQLFFEDRYKVTKAAILTRFETALGYEALKLLLCRSGSGLPISALLESGKVVIVNASQGTFGESGSRILGAFLMAEVSSLALSRATQAENDRREIFVYLDECQNFLNEKIDKILSEARKYKVHLTMATQHLGHFSSMLPLRRSIMANTGVKICGSVSVKDAKSMSQAIGLNVAKIDDLRAGKFAVKAGAAAPIVVQAHSHLLTHNTKAYLSDAAYQQLLAEQLQHYYLEAPEDGIDERQTSRAPNTEGRLSVPLDAPDNDFTLEEMF